MLSKWILIFYTNVCSNSTFFCIDSQEDRAYENDVDGCCRRRKTGAASSIAEKLKTCRPLEPAAL